jgi:nitroreductase
MEFSQLLSRRHSTRAFSDRPVDSAVVDDLLAMALESPSWSNTQPYRVAVASGTVLDDIGAELTRRYWRVSALQRAPWWRKLLTGVRPGVLPDGDFRAPLKYPQELQRRRVQTGKGLYETLGIERDDLAARDAQMARNFRFFDAPVALFLFVHKGLGVYSVLDAGIFLQSLMLAATDRGLGSCAQGALALWRSPLERHFRIPQDYKLLCGLSLGYEADSEVNRFRPERRPLPELLIPQR